MKARKILALVLTLAMVLALVPLSANAAFSPRDTDPIEDNAIYEKYYKSGNPYPDETQCVWYAWGRYNELCGVKLPNWGSGYSWYSAAEQAGFSVGNTPKLGAIACWTKEDWYGKGHVAVVEAINGDKVTVSQYNLHNERFKMSDLTGGTGYPYPTGYIYLQDNTPPAASSDFTIENGVLTNYQGSGGDVVIPEGVIEIKNSAFKDCTGLTSVTIPQGVTKIGMYAFYGCKNLTSVTVPQGVTQIGWYTFYGCTKLCNVTIPYGVTSIRNYAFDGCTSLRNVTIPASVTSIRDYAFCNSGLTNITIPASVTEIGEHAFSNCNWLTSVTVNAANIGGWAFSSCDLLNSVTIGNGVTSIGSSVFSGCTNLTVYGYADSYTEQYCSMNKIPFVSIDNGYPSDTVREGVLESNSGKSVSWAVTKEGAVTVPAADLAPAEKILVGCYDNNGRFTGVKWLDAQHATAQIDPNTPNVKLFWLGSKQNPLAPSVTVWGK